MFGKLLVDGMRKRNLNVQGMAMVLNMDKATVSRKMSGKSCISIYEAMHYANRLGIRNLCDYCPYQNEQKNRSA